MLLSFPKASRMLGSRSGSYREARGAERVRGACRARAGRVRGAGRVCCVRGVSAAKP